MMKRATLMALVLVLAGCAGPQPQEATPRVWVREIEPPPTRYQIKYQNRGLKVVPDFAGIERNGEWVVVPTMPPLSKTN